MPNDNKSLELQIRIATAEALKAVSSLKGEIEALAGEAKKFETDGGAKLKDSFKDAQNAAKETSMSIDDIKKAVGSLAEVVAATKVLSVIKDMGAFALQTADNFQTARNQFGILLGDMEAGAGLFNEIKAFNDVTPFDLDTLTQATNVLVAAKVPLQDLQAQLTKFGDLSQGNSQKMTSYVNAFSQAAAKGKADMQVLNTYLHQGVPILDALAKNFNVTTAEIVKMSGDGQISFADFSRALDELTSAGGRYFGGMELASKSLSAMQEGLSEAVNTLAASFGEMLTPAAIGVTQKLTDITNAINESPLAKGVLAAAITAATALMGVMAVKAAALAVKTWLAQAAQMGLNASLAVTNPLLWTGIAAAAAAAAGYVALASKQQQAAKETENFALEQRKLNDAIKNGTTGVAAYISGIEKFSTTQIRQEIERISDAIERLMGRGISGIDLSAITELRNKLEEHRKNFIDALYTETKDEKITELRNQIETARNFLIDVENDLEFARATGRSDKIRELEEHANKLRTIINNLNNEIGNLNIGIDINKIASDWKEAWAEIYGQFKADQAYQENDPFFRINLEQRKTLEDAYNNYVRSGNQKTIDEINEYYASQRCEAIRRLAEEEERLQRDLSGTKIDNIEHELKEALRAIDKLEAQRVIAVANSEEEIALIRERFAQMREDTELKFKIEIEKTKLDEAREAVKNWQEELSDGLLTALMNIEVFAAQASVVIGNLSAQFIELSASAALSGFEEFGRALGTGKDAAESLQAALASMARQILQQLPMMFLQAGLQLIANGQWPLGLGFIAAAGSSAIISGYVDGATKHAQGGVFDEYGQTARAYADGGAFTNQIVSAPTYFAHGGGFGLMGEAGPEAVVPLTRMPNGDLGVQTAVGRANVTVNVINNSGAEVRQEEREDADGSVQWDIIIGEMVDRHISSGKADRVMSGRYGLRAAGV